MTRGAFADTRTNSALRRNISKQMRRARPFIGSGPRSVLNWRTRVAAYNHANGLSTPMGENNSPRRVVSRRWARVCREVRRMRGLTNQAKIAGTSRLSAMDSCPSPKSKMRLK
jgi:hypothetical protein